MDAKTSLCAVPFVLVGLPGLAADQDSAPGAQDRHIEEIIVTAEKREERLLDVPLTMSAFSEQMIEELGMTNPNDIEQLVPGLQFGDNGEQVGQGTVIRGIGSRLAGETHSDLAVATYVDGVYTIGTYGVAPNLFDVERIEVARGPQGTLNGRNSIAGSISYFTKRPTDEWDSLFQVEFTDQTTQRYNVAFGGPLVGNLSFRINGGFYTGDGAQENSGLGGDYAAPDQTTFTPQLRYKTDRLDVNVRIALVNDDGSPRMQVPLSERNRTSECIVDPLSRDEDPECETNVWYLYTQPLPSVPDGCPPGTPGFECGDISNKLHVNRPGLSGSEGDQRTVSADYDLTDSFSLRYNYGSTDNFQQVTRDNDFTNRVGSAADPLLSADAGVPFDDVVLGVTYDYTEESHELQLISDLDGKVNFIGGVFRYTNHTTWSVPVWNYGSSFRFQNADEAAVAASPIFGFVPVSNCQDVLTDVIEGFGIGVSRGGRDVAQGWDCPEGNDHTQFFLFSTNGGSTTNAAFVNAEYQINEQWQVSGGLRYTEDEKEQLFDGGWIIFPIGGVPLILYFDDSDLKKRTWGKTIGHVSLEYAPAPDQLIYGRLSTGYRAGGFNTFSPGAPTDPIKEETLVNYEVGMKGLYLDRRLQLTAAAFYNDYSDYQINGTKENPNPIIPPTAESPLIEFTDNIEENKIWGAEAEFIYQANENWRFSGYYAWLGSEIGEHAEVVRGDPNPTYGIWEHLDFETGEPRVSAYVLPTDMTGNELPMQPKHKFAVTAAYSRPLDIGGEVLLLSTYSWTGERHADLNNSPMADLEAYGRLDLRGTWTSPDGDLSATLFVQNALDTIGLIEFIQRSTNSSVPHMGTLTDPRRIGLQVRWRP